MEGSICWYIILFLISFAIATIATPLISSFAEARNIVDQPGTHKMHGKAKPLLGGISIFISFAFVLLFFLPIDKRIISLVLSIVVLVITGLFDDLYDIKPVYKLSGQVAAATILVAWNAELFRFMTEYFARFYLPPIIVIGLIIGWAVLMVNAFNLIDGLDGLAAGTAAIIFLAMVALSILEGGSPTVLGVQLIGAGACLGFLIFNFQPAKLFMGDTGSMLLGFILVSVHLFTIKYPFSTQLVLGSMFIFAYPALDVSYAIYRRLANRRSILHADRGHIHHVLQSLGFSIRKTVLIIYLANIIFATIGVVLLGLDLPARLILIIGAALALFVVILFDKLLKISRHNKVY